MTVHEEARPGGSAFDDKRSLGDGKLSVSVQSVVLGLVHEDQVHVVADFTRGAGIGGYVMLEHVGRDLSVAAATQVIQPRQLLIRRRGAEVNVARVQVVR